MATNQSLECSNATSELISLLSNQLDKNFKKASLAGVVRNKILDFIKSNKSEVSLKAHSEENLFTEIYKLVLSPVLTLDIKFKAYNELTHSSKKLLIKRPKTFVDLNKEKEKILNVFVGSLGTDIIKLIDSLFSNTRTGYMFECDSFDMEEFNFTVDYSADYFGIDISIQKQN